MIQTEYEVSDILKLNYDIDDDGGDNDIHISKVLFLPQNQIKTRRLNTPMAMAACREMR